jgi:hypothetical protein
MLSGSNYRPASKVYNQIRSLLKMHGTGRPTDKPEPCEDEQLANLSRLVVARCLGSLGSNAFYIEAVHTLLVQHLPGRYKKVSEAVENLRKALEGVKEALNDTELNMGNYDDDGVRHLNDGAIEAWTIADEALAATELKP